MFQKLTLGRYLVGDSRVHLMDPRAKIIVCGLAMACSFGQGSVVGLSLVWPLIYLGLRFSRISPRYFFSGLAPLGWLFIVGIILHALTTPGRVLWPFTLLGVGWTLEGTVLGGLVALELFTAISLATLLTLTTSPDQLAWALARLMAPLEKVGVGVEEFFLSILMALKFFPLLGKEYETLVEERSRRAASTNTTATAATTKTTSAIPANTTVSIEDNLKSSYFSYFSERILLVEELLRRVLRGANALLLELDDTHLESISNRQKNSFNSFDFAAVALGSLLFILGFSLGSGA
jgi:energy-coupling factor transport system permease protein